MAPQSTIERGRQRRRTAALALLRALLPAMAVLAAVTLAGCSDDPTGNLQMNLVDAPTRISGVEAISITFSSVATHASGNARATASGWEEIVNSGRPAGQRTFDLLQLVNGVQATLGIGELPTGNYTQIRIIIDSATITVNGATEPLTIPSGEQTGLKLVGTFTINEDETFQLTVDFDAARSVRDTGSGYELKPTYRIVHTAESGSISGTVTPTGIEAVVAVYQTGADRSVAANIVAAALVDEATGGYMLLALEAGTYDLEASAPGRTTQVQTGVVVTIGEDNPNHDFTLVP